MAMDIQQLLLAKALEDAEAGPSMGQLAVGGGALGAGLGTLSAAISPLQEGRRGLNEIDPFEQQMLDDFSKAGKSKRGVDFGKVKRRGSRMAVGTLLGAILGGGLGAGTKSMFLSGMPNKAADILSKIQTSPEGLSEAEMLQLRGILRQIYSGQ